MAKTFKLRPIVPTEAQTQAAILRYLEICPRVAWAHRMNTGSVKIPVPGGRDRFLKFGFLGCPDVLGMFTDGRLLAVEVKSPTGRPTEAQQAFLKLVADNGGVAILARSVDDVTKILEEKSCR